MNVCMSCKMLHYNKIDASEGIDINSKEYRIFHYRYFKDIGYKCEP